MLCCSIVQERHATNRRVYGGKAPGAPCAALPHSLFLVRRPPRARCREGGAASRTPSATPQRRSCTSRPAGARTPPAAGTHARLRRAAAPQNTKRQDGREVHRPIELKTEPENTTKYVLLEMHKACAHARLEARPYSTRPPVVSTTRIQTPVEIHTSPRGRRRPGGAHRGGKRGPRPRTTRSPYLPRLSESSAVPRETNQTNFFKALVAPRSPCAWLRGRHRPP